MRTRDHGLPLLHRLYRFFVVGWTFASVYLSYKIIQKTPRISDAERERRLAAAHARNARRIYRAATRLDGLLIKVCQFISSRADVAPPEYVAILGRLQDQVPPRPFEEIAPLIEDELGTHPDGLFATFEREPIASASLAQVHRAGTIDGRTVAVKVQYPGIDRVVAADLSNLSLLVRILARIERDFDYRTLMDEISRYTPLELDFVHEGHASERIARQLAHRGDIRIPTVDWERTSTRVLTLEYIDGIKISDTAGMIQAGIDPAKVAQTVTEAYCEQILVHGFFHADPHPGNLMVLPGSKVVFVDFGLVKELPARFRRDYARLTVATLRGDDDEMVAAFRDLGFRTKSDDPQSLRVLGRSFWEATGPEARPYVDPDVIPELNERIARSLRENPVTQIPPDFLLIFRVLGLMSGLQKRLQSNVNMMQTIRPYAESSMTDTVPA
ncbi:MAG: ABC1 kinase family protein [Dehalococcoidia bacterium]